MHLYVDVYLQLYTHTHIHYIYIYLKYYLQHELNVEEKDDDIEVYNIKHYFTVLSKYRRHYGNQKVVFLKKHLAPKSAAYLTSD